MALYRGTRRVSGSGSTPYINESGMWETLGESTGVRATSICIPINTAGMMWNAYSQDGETFYTIEIENPNISDNDIFIGWDVANHINHLPTMNNMYNAVKNLNIIGGVVENGRIKLITAPPSPPTATLSFNAILIGTTIIE